MDPEIKLTHLGQAHKLPFNYTAGPEYVEKMIESQIKVANYIKNHPDALVFLEGLTESFSGIPEGMFTLSTKMIFPTGLPDDAAKLNSLQKDYLYNAEEAVRTMNRLGELKSMYRTISPEQSKVVDSLISDGDWSHMIGTREVAAMECIKEVLEKNPDKKEVILVYGDAHDFSKYCSDFGFQYEKISTVSSRPTRNESSAQNDVQIGNITKIMNSLSLEVEENSPLKSLNQRLIKYPKDISSRLRRAKILLSEGRKEEALEDYKFVLEIYPANVKAKKGVEFCN